MSEKYADKPTLPKDCVIVLTITDSRVTGWSEPKSFSDPRNKWKEGCSFVCLTQADIDQFIPPHSKDDEDDREPLDTPYYCQDCDHEGTLEDFEPSDGNPAPVVCPECGLTNCFPKD